jgi:hypothetical protein
MKCIFILSPIVSVVNDCFSFFALHLEGIPQSS